MLGFSRGSVLQKLVDLELVLKVQMGGGSSRSNTWGSWAGAQRLVGAPSLRRRFGDQSVGRWRQSVSSMAWRETANRGALPKTRLQIRPAPHQNHRSIGREKRCRTPGGPWRFSSPAPSRNSERGRPSNSTRPVPERFPPSGEGGGLSLPFGPKMPTRSPL